MDKVHPISDGPRDHKSVQCHSFALRISWRRQNEGMAESLDIRATKRTRIGPETLPSRLLGLCYRDSE